MEEVEYLYHYTSIENLALILKNKTIRLNPLDKMDDLQEQRSAEIKNFGKCTFVSCWTADREESIPMWNMYTPLTSGVRIKMRTRPFVQYDNIPVKRLREWAHKNSGQTVPEDNAHFRTYVDANWILNNGVITPHALGDDILYKVEYTNNKQVLEPSVLTQKDGQLYFLGNILGKHKNEHWKFQKEWRYLLSVYPWSPLQKEQTFPFPQHVDLQLDPTYFSEMEITCSPKMTSGNRVILETLTEKYNPSAKIIDSELLGKI